jgi:hypothetical protein
MTDKHQDEMTKLADLGFDSFGAYLGPRFAGLMLGLWNINFLRSLRALRLIFLPSSPERAEASIIP